MLEQLEEDISQAVSIRGKIYNDEDHLREIHLEKLLLVEGVDEVYFFDALVNNYKVSDIEIRDYGGKNKFKDNFPALVASEGFKKIKSLGIVRDGDDLNNNIEPALQSIKNVLKKIKDDETLKKRFADVTIPERDKEFSYGNPKIGIFIMNPMLEGLCLESVKGTKNIGCVNYFFKCLSKNEILPNNIYKGKVLAFLATKKKTVNHIGQAAQRGYWDFKSQCMYDIETFIKELVK